MRAFIIGFLCVLFLSVTLGVVNAQRGGEPLPLPDIPDGFRGIENPHIPTSPTEEIIDTDFNAQGIASRSLLAIVTNYAQLESAINAANTAPGIDHIIIVRVGTYTFDPPVGVNYDFNINSGVSVTLQGLTYTNLPADPDSVVFQRASTDSRSFSLFRVNTTGKLIIRNIRLVNGGGSAATFSGGAVRLIGSSTAGNGGILEIYDSRVVGNKISGNGGGVYVPSNAKLFITNTMFFW